MGLNITYILKIDFYFKKMSENKKIYFLVIDF